MLITLSGDRSIGIMRQGLMLPTANLRYRLRSMELLSNDKKPTVTMVLTHSDQATRRAIRTLGDYTHHSGTFVATVKGNSSPATISPWFGKSAEPA